jgi:CRP-like cAMP-binding protein
MRDGKVEQMRRVPMLRACSESELITLAGAAEMINVPAGSVLQTEGAEVKWFYLILTGDVAATRNGRLLGRSGAGTTVGEVELLCGSPATRSVMTAASVRAMVLSRRQFSSALDNCPTFRDAIVRSLARGLADALAEPAGDRELVRGPWRPRPAPAPAPVPAVSMDHPSIARRLAPTPSIGA